MLEKAKKSEIQAAIVREAAKVSNDPEAGVALIIQRGLVEFDADTWSVVPSEDSEKSSISEIIEQIVSE